MVKNEPRLCLLFGRRHWGGWLQKKERSRDYKKNSDKAAD